MRDIAVASFNVFTFYAAAGDSESGLVHRCCPAARLSVCLSHKCKNAIFSKTKQFRAMMSIDDLKEVAHGLFKEPIIGSLKSKMLRSAILKIDMTSFFSAEGGPIWIRCRRLVQNDMSTAEMWSKSKPDVEFQYGGRLGVSRITLQGAAT